MNESARSRPAHLSSVRDYPILHCLHCLWKIGVREDNVRILATELHNHMSNIFGRGLHNLTTSVARSREDDSVNILVRNQGGSDLSAGSSDHVHDTLRSPSLHCQLP